MCTHYMYRHKWGYGLALISFGVTKAEVRGCPKTTHYFIQGGPFDIAADNLIADGFKIDWTGFDQVRNAANKKQNKIKYTCPGCGLNAWGKPNIKLIYGDCTDESGEVVKLEADED